jgi:3-deoxy-D-manno-octulosonic-acid transferase
MNGYDLAYALGLGVASPVWLARTASRRKVLSALRLRSGKVAARLVDGPAVMIHAVSVGEMNATPALVKLLRNARPDLHVIISSTTDTGLARGFELYEKDDHVQVIRYPLDFSSAVRRALDAVRPDVVVLMELELWPNFMRECELRYIPVVLANGRLTEQSFRSYRRGKVVTKSMFRRLTVACVQDAEYAKRFVDCGVPEDRVKVTGTMKFDNAQIAESLPGARELAESVGLKPGAEPILVCGSTGPGEEKMILREYRVLLMKMPRLRLVVVPRKPERFNEVADLIESLKFNVVRRSAPVIPRDPVIPPVVLGDTMGELRKFYSVATVVFVGRSLVDLGDKQHGSDMIEPAALGKPTIVGPHTSNFADAMRKLKAADAIMEVPDARTLVETVSILVSTPTEADAMGKRAQTVVRREQGATARHAAVVFHELRRRLAQPHDDGYVNGIDHEEYGA